jgi:hypothetical protein
MALIRPDLPLIRNIGSYLPAATTHRQDGSVPHRSVNTYTVKELAIGLAAS